MKELDFYLLKKNKPTLKAISPINEIDKKVHEEIYEYLKVDPFINEFNIEVHVIDGIAKIKGTVKSNRIKKEVLYCVREVPGVKKISSKINIEKKIIL